MASTVTAKARTEGQRYLSEHTVRSIQHLQFAPRIMVDGAYAGKHKSPLLGHSQEFTDYREYIPGDEIKKIDWKVYGRTDRYLIKLSEQETVMTCYLLVDSSASMGFGGKAYARHFGADDVSKFDYAGVLAAALCYLIVKQGDKVGLTLFDSKIKAHVPAGGTYGHMHDILRRLEANRVGQQTSISRTLEQMYPLLNYRGILILISDLLDDPEELFGALDMYRYRNFEVILFHVLHKHELELPSLSSVNFIDSESGERITSIPADIRDSYQEQLQAHIEQLSKIAQSRRMDYYLMSTARPPQEALAQYISRRGRRWRL